ncbi:hypothetical protein Tco_0754213 [Tanacetum coccineum]
MVVAATQTHPYHGDKGGDGGVRLMVAMVGDGGEGGVGGVVAAATYGWEVVCRAIRDGRVMSWRRLVGGPRGLEAAPEKEGGEVWGLGFDNNERKP